MSIQEKIGEALETDRVTVTDTYGDGRHVSIDVVSPIFAGKSSVKRQQLVYKVCPHCRCKVQQVQQHCCTSTMLLCPSGAAIATRCLMLCCCSCRPSGWSCRTQCTL